MDQDSCNISESLDYKTILKVSDLKRDDNPFKFNKYDINMKNIDYKYIKDCLESTNTEAYEERIIDPNIIKELFFSKSSLFGIPDENINKIKNILNIIEDDIVEDDIIEDSTIYDSLLFEDNNIEDEINPNNFQEDLIINDDCIFDRPEPNEALINNSINDISINDNIIVNNDYTEPGSNNRSNNNFSLKKSENYMITPDISLIKDPNGYKNLQKKYKSDRLNRLTELLDNQSFSEIIRKKKEIISFCKNNNLSMDINDLDELTTKEIINIYSKISESESSDLTTILIIGSVNLMEYVAVNFFKIECLKGFTNDEFLKEANKFRTKFKSTVNYIDDKVGNPNRPGLDIIVYLGLKLIQRLAIKN